MEHDLAKIAESLRRPAGEAERFSTLDSIEKNRTEFVARCHDTWKSLHEQAVLKILEFDAFLQREKTNPTLPVVKGFGEYNRALWRKVNDAIAWSLFGNQRHVVKRLCLYRRRNFLADSNLEHAMTSIKMLNADPAAFALWNDATSCVDIGDITYIAPGRSGAQFIELKAGSVNDAILKMLANDSPETHAAFKQRYGEKGLKQLARVLRQKDVDKQALDLLQTDKGTDPVTGEQVHVVELSAGEERYDRVLNEVLRRALKTPSEIVERVDCLWILVNTKKGGRGRAEWPLDMLRAGLGRGPEPTKKAGKRDRVVTLEEGIFAPIAMPLFLRGLDADICAAVLSGKLRRRVSLYFDWDEFARIVASEGGRFLWSTEKESRRFQATTPALRPVTVRGRVPGISIGGVKAIFFDTSLIQVFFDGLVPRSMARRFLESASKVPGLVQ